jgi:hypothetical protein
MKKFLPLIIVAVVGAAILAFTTKVNATGHKLIRGEGNELGADLALDTANDFGLEMFCTRNRSEGTLQLYLTQADLALGLSHRADAI